MSLILRDATEKDLQPGKPQGGAKSSKQGRTRMEASEELWERQRDGGERKTLEIPGKRKIANGRNTYIGASLKV